MSRSMTSVVSGVTLAAAVLLAGLGSPRVEAQQKRVSFEGQGGVAIPTGRLADITDAGPTVGLTMSYPMTERTSLTVAGGVDALGGARLGAAQAPDMKLWRYGVGVEQRLIGQRPAAAPVRGRVMPRPNRWALIGDVGLGATKFDSQSFTAPGAQSARTFGETYLSAEAGLTLKYRAADRVQLFAGSHGTMTFANEDDTAVLASLDPRAQARAFGSAVTIPLSAGFTIRM